MLPSLFISHGSPQLVLMNNNTTDFLQELPKSFDKPKTIVIISAHWMTKGLEILSNEEPSIIYDFYGFPRELYEVEYKATNSIKKVDEIVKLFNEYSIDLTKNSERSGYDHGVWSILKLMYPKADIPIIQISLPMKYSTKELLKVGEVLSPLRADTLIISTGAMSHNLKDLAWNDEKAEPFIYSSNFRNWMVEKLDKGDVDSLSNFINAAPSTMINHPTLEHILPLFVSLGASKNHRGAALNNAYMYGQSMESILFKE